MYVELDTGNWKKINPGPLLATDGNLVDAPGNGQIGAGAVLLQHLGQRPHRLCGQQDALWRLYSEDSEVFR